MPMATCLIQANFSSNSVKQLEVSGLQALVLLAFNKNDHLTYQQLLEETGLVDKELNVQLISLAMMEHKVLLVNTPSHQQSSEIDAGVEMSLKKSLSVADGEPSQPVNEMDVQLKKSLSTSKQTFKRQVTPQDEFEVN